jgi:hypothetical protein
MKQKLFSLSASLLLGCFLAVNGWLNFQTIQHVQAHSHHDATTHASPLCTLFCSAGQMGQVGGLSLPSVFQHQDWISLPEPTLVHSLYVARPHSRGPPFV